jgi:hypothetical protein
MTTLFISQLEALDTTLEATKPANFNMDYYHKASLSTECGYVACVCGEQALSDRLKFFPIAHSLTESDTSFIVAHVAGYIDEDLQAACYTATGHTSLAESVTMVSDVIRKKKAEASEYLTFEQLQHPHLNSDSSPKHAASYIRMLIKVLTNE